MKYFVLDDEELFEKLLFALIPEDENPYFNNEKYENEYVIIYHNDNKSGFWFDTIIFKSEELHDLFLLKHF